MSIEIKKGDKLKVRLVTNGGFSWFGDGRGVIVNGIMCTSSVVKVCKEDLIALARNRGCNHFAKKVITLSLDSWFFRIGSEVEIVKVLK